MAGTLTISTLSDGTNSTSSTNCIQGSAKAWVNFNGTTGTIRVAYNVGSITKNATGDYTINITNALSDANYSAVVSVGAQSNTTLTNTIATASVYSSSATRISVFNTTNSLIDRDGVQVACFR